MLLIVIAADAALFSLIGFMVGTAWGEIKTARAIEAELSEFLPDFAGKMADQVIEELDPSYGLTPIQHVHFRDELDRLDEATGEGRR